MTWKTIDKAGYLFEQNDLAGMQDIEGVAHAEAFLKKFTRAFARISANFHDVVDSLPFEGERQIQSVVLPAMNEVAKVVYVEQPVERKKSRKKRAAGRIDYWVYYREFVFLIELKFSWVDVKPPLTIANGTCKAWLEALSQLNQIGKKEAKYHAMSPDKVLKIAMLLAPGIQQSKKEPKYFRRSVALELHERLMTDLSEAPEQLPNTRLYLRPDERPPKTKPLLETLVRFYTNFASEFIPADQPTSQKTPAR